MLKKHRRLLRREFVLNGWSARLTNVLATAEQAPADRTAGGIARANRYIVPWLPNANY